MFGLFKKKKPYRYYQDEYLVWIILNQSEDKKIHDWEVWKKCFEILDPILQKLPQKVAIRTSQTIPVTSDWLPFGRMIWSEKNNIKWTSKYKMGKDQVAELDYFDTEFWSPSWTHFHKEKITPAFFMKVETAEKGILSSFFDESITIAVKKGNDYISLAEIQKISECLGANYTIQGNRAWGQAASEDSWTNAFNHFNPYQLLDTENTKQLQLKEASSVFGKWELLTKQ